MPEGRLTSFTMAVQRNDGESVVFAWIAWPPKEARDAGMKQSLEGPRFNMDPATMRFDGRPMTFGGFRVLVEG